MKMKYRPWFKLEAEVTLEKGEHRLIWNLLVKELCKSKRTVEKVLKEKGIEFKIHQTYIEAISEKGVHNK